MNQPYQKKSLKPSGRGAHTLDGLQVLLNCDEELRNRDAPSLRASHPRNIP